MTKNRTIAVTESANNTNVTYATGSPVTATIFTPGADGSQLRDILFRNKVGSTKTFTLYITKSGVDKEIGDFIVPANAGNGSIPVARLSELLPGVFKYDNNGNRVWNLESGELLKVLAAADVGTAMPITVVAEDY